MDDPLHPLLLEVVVHSGEWPRRHGAASTVRAVAAAVAAVVAASLLQAVSLPARADAGTGRPAVNNPDRTVKGKAVEVRPRRADPAVGKRAPRPVWPTAGTVDVAVPVASAARSAPSRAGDLPVWVGAPDPSGGAGGTAGKVRVRVLDRPAAERVGVDGLLFTVGRTDTVATPGRVGVRVDYASFAPAYGGSYGSRLHLVRLPACALTTPQQPECRTMTRLNSRNNGEAQTLTADVDVAPVGATADAAAAGGTVLAAVAGASGDQGSYKATSLSASATWNAGGNSGDFSWSYPMRVPPVPGGLEPEVQVSYSSASVDGRTANTNNQPSWVGEGFDLWPGYIERSYKACAEDGAPKSNGIDPGDQCWAYDNATVTWNGKGGELIQATDGTWRMKNDDGTRFERLADASIDNGDNNREYWKATTADGTQYFFGRHKLPGWSSGKAVTNSTWTVPVFGNNAGEPCHDAAGFAESWCQQAWRWNLDYAVDPNGNAVTYYYTPETNYYGRNVTPSADTLYERGGYLDRIEYGLRSSDLFAKPPAKVTFAATERCIADASFDCAPSKIGANPDKWPDVPWDQNCTSECTTKGLISPTFWSRKRLTGVTTQIQKSDGSYRDVDSWALQHAWGEADIDRALLLQSIQHTGKATSPAVTLPKVTFNHVQLTNRLDKVGDDIPPFIKYRVGAIFDESGGQIDVTYSGTECTLTDLPTPETNTKRCFPTYWQPAGHDAPIRDWFHKYVVTQVIQSDRTGRAPDMVTSYAYLGGAAWHFDDDDGLTKTKEKTWSQWRGYGQVQVTTGGMNDPRTRTDHLYLRGMDGDRLNTSGGTKDVRVADGEGSTHTDHEALAGFDLKTTVYTAPGGSVHSKTVNTPWRHQTASRIRSWGTTTASLTGAATTRTWTAMDGGTWRQTRIDTAHDTVAGLPTQVDDQADTATAADDRCTRTSYAVNTNAWLRNYPSRVETVSVNCATNPDRSRHVISDVRTFYDGGALGSVTKGDVTKVEEIAAHDGSTATYVPSSRTTYDAYGRPRTVTDAAGNTTTTDYSDTAGLTTKITTTSPEVTPGNPTSAHVTERNLDPAWGQPTAETDAGGKTTTLAYDALGRLTTVRLPGRATAPTPDIEYAYQVTDGQIVAVTTKTITPTGGQGTSHELFDGLLRTRQTQTEGPDGGRLITDTFYDSRGNIDRTYDTYYATGSPATVLFGVSTPGDVESQLAYSYDGLNRVTVERFLVGNNDTQEKWRTTTSYGGNWVAVDPPDGATPTMTISDARGRKTEVRQYKDAAPTGDYDSTRYTYHPTGKLATVTGTAGEGWSYTYDLRGRETTTVDPDNGTAVSTYDDLDQLTSTTDARGETLFYKYDALGRRTELREGSATGTLRVAWVYDTVRKGQPTSATRYSGGQVYTSKVDIYDNLNRPVRRTITIPSIEEALAGGYTFSTAYNLDGTVQSNSFPAAGGLPAETVVNTYDDTARPTRLTSNLGTYINATTYSATGKPLQYELQTTGGKKAWQTLTWEYGTNRLATARTDREGIAGVDRNATYTYDPAGNITSISDVSRDGPDTQCFTYDHVQRLTEAWTQASTTCAAVPSTSVVGGPASYWHSYTYDAAGNRATEVIHGATDTTRTYTNEGHRLTGVNQTGAAARADVFKYDASGNMTTRTVGDVTQTLNWDAEGELTTITDGAKATSFVYDANGDRLIRRDPTGITLFLPDMELRLPAGAAAANGTRYYRHNGETLAMRTVTGVDFLSNDHQDTAHLAIDAGTQTLTKRRFTPFGAERGTPAGTWPDEKTFVGGTSDASTGLTHLGAREYDPTTGRFISVDPLFNMEYPQSWNGYSYANHSPVTISDPDGLDGPLRGDTNCYYSGKCKKPKKRSCWGWECTNGGAPRRSAPRCWGWECTNGGGTAVKPKNLRTNCWGWECTNGGGTVAKKRACTGWCEIRHKAANNQSRNNATVRPSPTPGPPPPQLKNPCELDCKPYRFRNSSKSFHDRLETGWADGNHGLAAGALIGTTVGCAVGALTALAAGCAAGAGGGAAIGTVVGFAGGFAWGFFG